MNESMNFGNIGFSSVSIDSTQTVAENNVPATNVMSDVNTSANVATSAVQTPPGDDAALNFGSSTVVKKDNYERDADNFSNIEFGPLKQYLDDDNITDISYSNGGQLWLKSLDKGVYRADQQDVNNALVEKIAFQCSNVMGKTFNMAHPFLDSESAELRMNFVHDSIARNGIAAVFRKTPAKIRLEKQKLLNEKYVTLNIHDFLINCVKGHCNIIVCGETGSGKTELVKYLASHTANNEKLITIEDTLELHLDRIFPQRDIVAMKTNNIASYSDVLVTCMRQNPKWILLSEVRSAEAVTAVRNSISSGHNILSTIHADKAESIPHRMYSLLESNIDVEQFLKTIYRYVQLGIFVRGRYDPAQKRFVREVAGVTEFFVTDDNEAQFNNIYLKTVSGEETFNEPSKYMKSYLEGQGVDINNLFGENKSSLASTGVTTNSLSVESVDNKEGNPDNTKIENTSISKADTQVPQAVNSTVASGAVVSQPLPQQAVSQVVAQPVQIQPANVVGASVPIVSHPNQQPTISQAVAQSGQMQPASVVAASVPAVPQSNQQPAVSPVVAQPVQMQSANVAVASLPVGIQPVPQQVVGVVPNAVPTQSTNMFITN